MNLTKSGGDLVGISNSCRFGYLQGCQIFSGNSASELAQRPREGTLKCISFFSSWVDLGN